MSGFIISAGEQKNRPLPPAETHLARVVDIIDLGTQVEINDKGEKKEKRKLRVTFELPNERAVFDEAKGDEPFLIGRTYTQSMHEKSNLRPLASAVLGKTLTDEECRRFDVTALVGRTCLVSVEHRQKKDGSEKNIKYAYFASYFNTV